MGAGFAPAQLLTQTQVSPGDHVRIDCQGNARSAVLHWPTTAPEACAQWLNAWLS